MAKVSVSVTGITTQNKDNSRTLGYVNPEATNAQLKQMAIAYNALSTKTYQGGEKIVRTDINDPEPSTGKQEPTLTAVAGTNSTSARTVTITYNGDGELFFRTEPISLSYASVHWASNQPSEENTNMVFVQFTGNFDRDVKLKINATEGTNYAAKTITVDSWPEY